MLPSSMLTMSADLGHGRLAAHTVPLPVLQARDVLVKVLACGVCRTDLRHEIVGRVVARGAGARR